MEAFEAMAKAINRDTPIVAKSLKLSKEMVNKWQEDPEGSGAKSPLLRVEQVCAFSLRRGNPLDVALAPIFYLNRKFGLAAFPVPEGDCLSKTGQQLCKTIKEFGDLVSEAGQALMDNELHSGERKRVLQEGWEAMEALRAFLTMVED